MLKILLEIVIEIFIHAIPSKVLALFFIVGVVAFVIYLLVS